MQMLDYVVVTFVELGMKLLVTLILCRAVFRRHLKIGRAFIRLTTLF